MKVVKDTSIAGVDVRSGQWVRLLLPAANRDPSVFADPDLFDVERPNSTDALSFGTGQHMCLGTHLANTVTVETVGALAEHLPGLHIPPDAQYDRAQGMLHRFDSALMEY